ncbi:MAG: hypothetical protein ACRDZ7_01045 [Acidimicrobiia bacterium]
MPKKSDTNIDEEFAGTASRSGYDSASEMSKGRVKEATGKLVGDERMREEGATQQEMADAAEKEDLKTWRRQHGKP